ncbi:MAG: nucleotidyltransferase domain-containing protein [Defluviitaleaceae bacterium]|nr:nucleotidyltransferase domain-containing protein [Defluviitaleaceae bacterium]
MKNINDAISKLEYDFLRTDKHLGNNIIFLCFGGSHAYGTNDANSDIDIRGCAFNQKSDLIGLSSFEQFTDNKTIIYSFNKLINLLINCNPNAVELLGCKPEHYIVNSVGQEMISNRKMFLSRKVVNSFGGYANKQLKRLQNAVAKDNNKKTKKILNKYAQNLTRLYLMAIDIFEKEEIITYRENDLPLLLSIRNGKYINEDGTYQSEFFDLINEFERRLDYAKETSGLPVNPDYKKIEEFVMHVNKKVVVG